MWLSDIYLLYVYPVIYTRDLFDSLLFRSGEIGFNSGKTFVLSA